MKDFEFSLDDDADFMLKNFKKNFMIWVVPVTEVLSYLVRKVWSRAVYPRSFPSGHAKLSNFLYHQAVDDDKTICSKRLPFMVRFISDAFEFVNEANQAAA